MSECPVRLDLCCQKEPHVLLNLKLRRLLGSDLIRLLRAAERRVLSACLSIYVSAFKTARAD